MRTKSTFRIRSLVHGRWKGGKDGTCEHWRTVFRFTSEAEALETWKVVRWQTPVALRKRVRLEKRVGGKWVEA